MYRSANVDPAVGGMRGFKLQAMSKLMNQDVPIEIMFKMLYKSYTQLQIQLGQEKAYNEELEECIKNTELRIQQMKTENTEASKAIKKEAMYKRLKNQVVDLKKRIKELKASRDDLMSQLNLLNK